MRKYVFIVSVALAPLVLMTGCTVHPPGEQAERDAAVSEGRPYGKPVAERSRSQLPEHPTADDLVRYALLSNADLERQYWEWRAAIEQIPQDGTQATNLAISAGTTLSKGGLSADRTTLTALNDPMADIVWPEKLSVAARRALQNADAAGLRFQKAKFDLRSKVLIAWYDYALAAESIRLAQADSQLLQTTVTVVDARYRSGGAGQQDLLKAHNELDLSRNDIANMQSQLPALRASLNALLNRDVNAPPDVPTDLPAIKPIAYSDDQLLSLAARQNPELKALASEIEGRREGIELARLQYVPDFSLSAGTDLAGLTQSLAGMVTVPVLRHEAIDASIAQAEAYLKSTEAMRRQAGNDLRARVITDIATLRDADRQLNLFEHAILPRASQAVSVARSSYESGQSSLLDFLDAERSLTALERLVANLRITREKQLADLEDAAQVIIPVAR